MSKYDKNPWLDTSTTECRDLAIAVAKWYNTAKFPKLVEDASDEILHEMETADMLSSAEHYGDPKATIGRHLSKFCNIRGRQLRRNGSRFRYYVVTDPVKITENVKFSLLLHGIEPEMYFGESG